jgi:Tuberculosis necrotizing toxin
VAGMFAGLRQQLSDLGLTPFDIQLPGEDSHVAPLEGALRLTEVPGGGYELATVDYGRPYRLGTARTPEAAAALVSSYVSRPLPPIRPIAQLELDEIVGKIAYHYFDLRDRARAAGPDGVVIDLPPQIPLDRIGALDGVHLYPIDTPFEFRSLPPHAIRPESDVHKFVTARTVRVQAAITPPWFGRPGGGIRYTLQEPQVGIRDLVVSGALQRLHVTS